MQNPRRPSADEPRRSVEDVVDNVLAIVEEAITSAVSSTTWSKSPDAGGSTVF